MVYRAKFGPSGAPYEISDHETMQRAVECLLDKGGVPRNAADWLVRSHPFDSNKYAVLDTRAEPWSPVGVIEVGNPIRCLR